MNKLENVLVSIFCITYNHGKYIRQALDGILMQKTNFEYEVIIGDDCSKDNSRQIILEYKEKFGDKLKILFHEHNLGAIENVRIIESYAKGKYVISLETDDYWTDPYKLQKQVDYLDAHPEVFAVAHRCQVVDVNSDKQNVIYPECKTRKYKTRHYRNWILPGQYTTVMYKNYYSKEFNLDFEYRAKASVLGPGDRLLVFMTMARGEIHCLPDVMSCYRYVTQGGSSFSANNNITHKQMVQYYDVYIEYCRDKNVSTDLFDTAKMLYLEELIASTFIEKSTTKKAYKKLLKENQISLKCFWYMLLHVIYRISGKIIGKIRRVTYI